MIYNVARVRRLFTKFQVDTCKTKKDRLTFGLRDTVCLGLVFLVPGLPTSSAIPVGDALWDCRCSFFFFFFLPLLSRPYLWNRYSQRLQIECAAWSCCLILHYSLPSNLLHYFFIFFRHDFVRAISLEPLLAETPN